MRGWAFGQTHQRYRLGNGDKREVRWNIAHRSSLSLSEVGQNPAGRRAYSGPHRPYPTVGAAAPGSFHFSRQGRLV